jgi:hydroxymethylbilane synthase
MSESPRKVRLGTRGSALALAQSEWVRSRLRSQGVEVELVLIRTAGDDLPGSLAQIGGQGVFTKQLQTALLAGQIDLAVHSLKDLPTTPVAGMHIAARPKRENPADVLVSGSKKSFRDLPAGSRIGTGSLRRSAQIRRLRNDLVVEDIRGNVDTRLRKLDEGQFDAIVLAAAGLIRLDLTARITDYFPTRTMFPAVGQGALGLEIRDSDAPLAALLPSLNDRNSYCAVMAERAMLRGLNAGCLSAVGAESTSADNQLQLTGIVLSPDGTVAIQATSVATMENHLALGQAVADELVGQGAADILGNRCL